ncbi:thiamine-phosphate pyrophosphorylase [Candidatus Margulisiibacteriota bacterium]
MDDKYLRIIDANLNRAKEGLRVVEEVARFILNDEQLSKNLKTVRQSLRQLSANLADRKETILARDSENDVGANTALSNRKSTEDIVKANMSRVQEALRVLEEFSDDGMPFQALRYEAYTLEKRVLEKRRKAKNDKTTGGKSKLISR